MKDREVLLLVDELIDIINRSQLCVMVMFGNLDGDIVIYILGFVNLKKGIIEVIMEVIKLFLLVKDVDIVKIRFIV